MAQNVVQFSGRYAEEHDSTRIHFSNIEKPSTLQDKEICEKINVLEFMISESDSS